MNLLRILAVSALSCMLVTSTACSSSKSTKKAAASGAAKPTTKQPSSAPKPTKKTGSNVSGSVSSAVPVEADPDCTAAEEGLAACVDTFAVFCASGKVYAVDCAEAFAGATCGELGDATIDCVVTIEE